ncbi:MAG: hypothetical protein HYY01_11755 [Chloroflexi bacterium]|nr:hypothetical protein [Chloroflexota bacterium]
MSQERIVLLSPVGRGQVTGGDWRAPRLRDLRGKVAGLLDDRMSTSDHFLARVGELLLEQQGVARVVSRRKPTPVLGSPPELIAAMVRECDFVVVGCGT